MRITAGSAKGRRLKSPPGLAIRPTPVRAREAIFSILGKKIVGARFLDLLAGSGIMGLEALSRGAAFCWFNDFRQCSCRIIAENLRQCDFIPQAQISKQDVFVFLKIFGRRQEQAFDFVYVDPPYDFTAYERLLTGITAANLLAPAGEIIVETDKRTVLAEEYEIPVVQEQTLRLRKKSQYGDTLIWFFKLWRRE